MGVGGILITDRSWLNHEERRIRNAQTRRASERGVMLSWAWTPWTPRLISSPWGGKSALMQWVGGWGAFLLLNSLNYLKKFLESRPYLLQLWKMAGVYVPRVTLSIKDRAMCVSWHFITHHLWWGRKPIPAKLWSCHCSVLHTVKSDEKTHPQVFFCHAMRRQLLE